MWFNLATEFTACTQQSWLTVDKGHPALVRRKRETGDVFSVLAKRGPDVLKVFRTRKQF